MIPAACAYTRATSIEDALELIGGHPEAKLLAGGQSLVPLLKLRLAMPDRLIDLGGLRELSYVRDEGDFIAIGALTRHFELARSALVRTAAPLVAEAAGHVGDPQVRHWGTLGGSLCHADPAADLAAAALAHDARLVVRGPRGHRTVPVGDWFLGLLTTALESDEILVEVQIPRMDPSSGWSFVKFTRRAIDWATVGVAVLHGSDKHRVALMNMGDRPMRAVHVEDALANGLSYDRAAVSVTEGTRPPSDVRASSDYRRRLAPVLTRRALLEAAERSAAAEG